MDDRETHAIELLASGASVTGTARAVGVDRTTINRWRKRPDFRLALERRRSELEAERHERYGDLENPRLVLVRVMNDPAASAAAQVQAASTLARLDEYGGRSEGTPPPPLDPAECADVVIRAFESYVRLAASVKMPTEDLPDPAATRERMRVAARQALRLLDEQLAPAPLSNSSEVLDRVSRYPTRRVADRHPTSERRSDHEAPAGMRSRAGASFRAG